MSRCYNRLESFGLFLASFHFSELWLGLLQCSDTKTNCSVFRGASHLSFGRVTSSFGAKDELSLVMLTSPLETQAHFHVWDSNWYGQNMKLWSVVKKYLMMSQYLTARDEILSKQCVFPRQQCSLIFFIILIINACVCNMKM